MPAKKKPDSSQGPRKGAHLMDQVLLNSIKSFTAYSNNHVNSKIQTREETHENDTEKIYKYINTLTLCNLKGCKIYLNSVWCSRKYFFSVCMFY